MRSKFLGVGILFLVLSIALIGESAVSQVIRIDEQFPRILRLKNSAKDSILTTDNQIPLKYDGNSTGIIKGQLPDSIVIAWCANADSIARIFVRFKATMINGSYSSVLVDSIKQLTAAATNGAITISAANYNNMDYIGASFNAQASGNATLTANASDITVRFEKYFKIMIY